MNDDADTIAALIALHHGLERQGPGDEAFTRRLLSELPALPPNPRIADLGCGSGSGALLLAEQFHSPVLAVDFAAAFLEQLRGNARRRGLDHLVMTLEADMGALDWNPASVDLLWSEGAAYVLGFTRALQLWRPLLPDGGVAVISELSWFTSDIPPDAREFWRTAYPGMGSEEENCAHAQQSGYAVVATRRLPSQAWWDHYYNPLKGNIARHRAEEDHVMQKVIRETEQEMEIFERCSESYGYTFYVLKAI